MNQTKKICLLMIGVGVLFVMLGTQMFTANPMMIQGMTNDEYYNGYHIQLTSFEPENSYESAYFEVRIFVAVPNQSAESLVSAYNTFTDNYAMAYANATATVDLLIAGAPAPGTSPSPIGGLPVGGSVASGNALMFFAGATLVAVGSVGYVRGGRKK